MPINVLTCIYMLIYVLVHNEIIRLMSTIGSKVQCGSNDIPIVLRPQPMISYILPTASQYRIPSDFHFQEVAIPFLFEIFSFVE